MRPLLHRALPAAGLLVATLVAATTAAVPAFGAGELSPPLGPVLSLAHRGASGAAPEHTFFAYDEAVRADADFLECDLQLTRDDVLVCIHDDTVDRTSDAGGRVDAFTLAELRTQDFGSWFNTANPTRARPEFVGARVVPFEEQLDCYRALNPRLRFHVETKVDPAYGDRLETGLVRLLGRKGLLSTGDVQTSRVLVQSFDLTSLERTKQLAPGLPTVFLSAAPPADQLDGSAPAYVDGVSPAAQFLVANPSYVAAAHAGGRIVHTYTVNDQPTMDVLLQQGVDGIFTNEPALLRGRIDARGTGVPASERANPTSFAPLCPGVAGRVRSADGPGDAAPAPAPPAAPAATPTATTSPTSSPAAAPVEPSPAASPSGSPAPAASPSETPSATPSATPSTSPSPTGSPAPDCVAAAVRLSPSQVTAGRSAAVTLAARPGRDVELLAYTRPSTEYRVVRRGRTGPDGLLALTVRPPANTRLVARETGCPLDRDGSRVLGVRADLSLLVRRTAERTYVFAGDSLPARADGLAIALYRVEPSGRQVLSARVRAGADGRWSTTRRFTGSGRFGFVVRTGRDLRNDAGSSVVRQVTIG